MQRRRATQHPPLERHRQVGRIPVAGGGDDEERPADLGQQAGVHLPEVAQDRPLSGVLQGRRGLVSQALGGAGLARIGHEDEVRADHGGLPVGRLGLWAPQALEQDPAPARRRRKARPLEAAIADGQRRDGDQQPG